MTLCASSTKRVTEAEVVAVPEPEFTPTWHPISHKKVVNTLDVACQEQGIRVLNREYSINGSGSRMFGVWDLDLNGNGIGYSLGIRNSIDKSMGLGMCGGTRVFVCDNLCFSGEFLYMRKHTSGLDMEELVYLAKATMQGALGDSKTLLAWQKTLERKFVPRDDFKIITCDLMDNGVFAPSKYQEYTNSVEEETRTYRSKFRSLADVHGGVTRLFRGQSLFNTGAKSAKLNAVIDNYLLSNPIIE